MSEEQQIDTTEMVAISHESILENLENELRERIRRAGFSAEKAKDRQRAAVCEAIRVGWLVRDVQDQLKGDSTISFKDWIESRFKKTFTVASATAMAKAAREFQCDGEYNMMRDRFGLDPRLISSTSEETLEVQVENRSKQPEYVPLIRSIGLAPAKGESKPREKKEPRSDKDKVLRSLALTLERYLKFKESRETWDGELYEILIEKLRGFKDEYEYLTNGGHVPEGEGVAE
jgi:hypothetical protein